MLTLEKKYTIDDFKKIEEGKYYQLIKGEIIMSPSPSFRHQEISIIIANQLFSYVQKHKLGKLVYAPMDVYFDEENVYEPDILFVSNRNLDIIKNDGIYGVPDLIIEILSTSNSYNDTKTKKKIYEKYRVKEYWIVDPLDGEVIGFENKNKSFKEFFRGYGEFQIKLLKLKIKFEY